MPDLFSDPGIRTMTIVVLMVYLASFALMVIMIAEYKHVHNKRVALLTALESKHIKWTLRERYILIVLYLVGTIASTFITGYFFLNLL